MNKDLKEMVVIRQRGQITIPDRLRDFYPWLSPNSVVTVSSVSDEEIVIRPYTLDETKKIDWEKIWEGIRLARSFRGKRGNLSRFIAEDRRRH